MSPDGSTLLFGAIPAELKFSSQQKQTLKRFAQKLSIQVAGRRAFTCLITDDRELQRLNKQFLGCDYATDVLSFPAAAGAPVLGEIAISIERAAAQARDFGHSPIDEIRILMLHGVLHLTGMDHESDDGEMAEAERKWAEELELSYALIERASAEAARL